MKLQEIETINWESMAGLLPAIVQDALTNRVLMLGYMNEEALQQTLETGWVTFYSRSKKRLWKKGETSGHTLKLVNMALDCDQDALLILAEPTGPTCHTGSISCFKNSSELELSFLKTLEATIHNRKQYPKETSYTTKLFAAGISRIAQKVGEEGVEVSLAAVTDTNENICSESADLLFHLLVLLSAKELSLVDVINVLKTRHK